MVELDHVILGKIYCVLLFLLFLKYVGIMELSMEVWKKRKKNKRKEEEEKEEGKEEEEEQDA